MKSIKGYTISYFKCPKCGLQMTVPRKKSRQREKGHIKDLYCARCDEIVKMIENDFVTLADKLADEEKTL